MKTMVERQSIHTCIEYAVIANGVSSFSKCLTDNIPRILLNPHDNPEEALSDLHPAQV